MEIVFLRSDNKIYGKTETLSTYITLQIHVLNPDELISTTPIHHLRPSTPWKVLVSEDFVATDRNPKIAV
jgi:hypothetical protein